MADGKTDPINLRVFASQLRTTEDDDLFQLEKEVKALIELPGWEKIERVIAASADRLMQSLKYANVKDHATMARDLGMVAGMEVQSACATAVLLAADQRRADIERALERETETARGT